MTTTDALSPLALLELIDDPDVPASRRLMHIAEQLQRMVSANELLGADPRAVALIRLIPMPLLQIAADVRLLEDDAKRGENADV